MLKKRLVLLFTLLLLAVPFVGATAQTNTIVDVAAGNPDFSTLVSLVQAAGLVDTLKSDGPFTVFAPTNEAFAKLPKIVVDFVVANPDVLKMVLTYHVVPAKIMAADAAKLTTPTEVDTAAGDKLTVVFDGTNVKVDDATVVAADVEASNGVIHVIDQVILPTLTLPEVTPITLDGDIAVDGSSTVEPLTVALAKLFTDEGFAGNITVGESGTGGGFKAFCEELVTDISNASRAIKVSKDPAKQEEFEKCVANGRDPLGFRVGTDGIAVVINPQNDFATDVTKDELAAIFSTAEKWSDVRADWPAEPIERYVPGTDSGTWDFFVEKVFENKPEIPLAASKLNQSENDNVLVQGVEGGKYAVGFFGYAYYEQNAGKLKAVSIDGVLPTAESTEKGTYLLARPLYIYSDPKIMQSKPQVAGFINFYLQNVNAEIGKVGYFAASDFALNRARALFIAATAGGM